jgi:lysophospholipase L1-like esterase
MAEVLLIGDSHSNGYYGVLLKGMFEKAKNTVTKVAHGGISAGAYLAGKEADYPGKGTLADVAGQHFDIAIITLGTNDLGDIKGPDRGGRVAENLRLLASKLNADQVWWVGAPAFSDNAARTYNKAFAKYDLNKRAQVLWEAASPIFGSRAIDPRSATRPFTDEKEIHFLTPEGGKAWAEYVYRSVTEPKSGFGGVLLLAVVAAAGYFVWKNRRRFA